METSLSHTGKTKKVKSEKGRRVFTRKCGEKEKGAGLEPTGQQGELRASPRNQSKRKRKNSYITAPGGSGRGFQRKHLT